MSRNEEFFQNENFNDEELDISNEEDFKKIENELKKNRADAILDNLEDKCENTSANFTNSSICNFFHFKVLIFYDFMIFFLFVNMFRRKKN